VKWHLQSNYTRYLELGYVKYPAMSKMFKSLIRASIYMQFNSVYVSVAYLKVSVMST